MFCGGYVGRLYVNNFKDYKLKKFVDQLFIFIYVKDYLKLVLVKCECVGKRVYFKKCGCMLDEFLGWVKSNYFLVLKQSGNDFKEYVNRMYILGKYYF